ncbi:MAG TPA: hypothetical protein VHL52_09680, partial [Acidimicrobiia bacterium]|nr:hypothetical protein [Acidimicrobiia bacterium]
VDVSGGTEVEVAGIVVVVAGALVVVEVGAVVTVVEEGAVVAVVVGATVVAVVEVVSGGSSSGNMSSIVTGGHMIVSVAQAGAIDQPAARMTEITSRTPRPFTLPPIAAQAN